MSAERVTTKKRYADLVAKFKKQKGEKVKYYCDSVRIQNGVLYNYYGITILNHRFLEVKQVVRKGKLAAQVKKIKEGN